ncbi:YbaZ [Pantoea ananatis LMG 20103]|uniref:DNA base-flipping protein n=3 Tax=Pantoea ananas TaxID=553 RepID=D4GLQ9_PANAM|nr:YbaZ [Pantoea ananatis LMG 20103]PKC44232.1 methyltransferase [Pantoea ananatis BRT98]BAK10419.1 methyltransferase YbaZ [Pantoea ananatis AJ13355]
MTSPHFESAGIIGDAPGNCKPGRDDRWFLVRSPIINPQCDKIIAFSRAGKFMDSSDSFKQRIWQIVAAIPPGRVTTYGDVALLAGSPRAARQVGGVLSRLPEGSTLPWHRVINRHGTISLQGDRLFRQREALEAEGVEVSDAGEIDLDQYRWRF